jgi:hypothetical protein
MVLKLRASESVVIVSAEGNRSLFHQRAFDWLDKGLGRRRN